MGVFDERTLEALIPNVLSARIPRSLGGRLHGSYRAAPKLLSLGAASVFPTAFPARLVAGRITCQLFGNLTHITE